MYLLFKLQELERCRLKNGTDFQMYWRETSVRLELVSFPKFTEIDPYDQDQFCYSIPWADYIIYMIVLSDY